MAQHAEKSCCRLCLAPNNECVEIFKTQAADKLPIQTKIKSCVQVQVSETDGMSQSICHVCVSYLNSWQSFKNRCDAAQRKQKAWLATPEGKSTGQSLLKTQLNQNQLKPAIENAKQKFQEKQVELQRKKLHQLVQQQQANHQIDTSFIKSEPTSDDDEGENVIELDPSQFLAQESSDDESDLEDDTGLTSGADPSILTSLGLTHVNSASTNPYASLIHSEDDDKSETSSTDGRNAQVPANCTVCNMQFSNRANARRHEKNIHHLKPTPIGGSLQQASALQQTQPKVVTQPSKKGKITSINIDYAKPELYRHLLTGSKLQFILSNLNFLEQFQELKCKCCNKQFPSYKFFMGHMRKKYHGLPRNVCFKCLKQFDSKGQFIGHLKRPGGSCPNLYKLVMADDKIPKNLLLSDTNLRTPAKDVLANRVYACAICDDTFRLKSDFREHVYRTHLEVTKNRETPNASCINCNESFTDSAVRRRHFNNLDCIVYIVCKTCGEQFPTQAGCLDHIYQTHLKNQENSETFDEVLFEEPEAAFNQNHSQSSTAMTPGQTKNVQECPVCQKQYNNYYNVLRHMEAKHPDQVPQTYQCPECPEGKFSKQTYLREHLLKVHNIMKSDVSRQSTGASNPLSEIQDHAVNQTVQQLPAYVCKATDCGMEFREKAKWLDHQVDEHDSQLKCMFCDFIDNERNSFENHLEVVHQHQIQTDTDDEGNTPSKVEESKSYKCCKCTKRIGSKTGLQKHMIKVHNIGGELVKCTLCTSEFANDKGLKVHLWRCHGKREADYESVLPPDLLDPYTQQQRKLKQEEEQKTLIMANESGIKPMKVYECPLCHIVYTSRDELADHQKSIHAMDDVDVLEQDDPLSSMMDTEVPIMSHVTGDDDDNVQVAPAPEQEYWFQCRFCQRSFNSSKKLTIHMNSHQEGGSSNAQDTHGGYPCKECGVVYKSKKSLWVHRHKKHPRVPNASPCDSCGKVFFDKAEFAMHLQHVHPGNIPQTSAEAPSSETNESMFTEGHWLLDSGDGAQLKTEPSDTTPIVSVPKKRKRPAPSETPDGQYACDMCPKAFSNANALQVHRGWHFRSPDGRKVTDPSQMWMPDQTPPSKVRRSIPTPHTSVVESAPTSTKCPHCNGRFASLIDLSRHIKEVHKKSQEGNNLIASDGLTIDRVGECTLCDVMFATVAEWVDHKINDVKLSKSSPTPSTASTSSGSNEWTCEICSKVFTIKERLLQHMLVHTNDREIDPDVLIEHQIKLENNAATSTSSESSDDEEDVEASDDENDENEKKVPNLQSTTISFSCELCHIDFASSQELRSHVSDHFLSGPSIQQKQTKKEVEDEIDDLELEEAHVDYAEPDDENDEEDGGSSSSSDEGEDNIPSSSEDNRSIAPKPEEIQPRPPLPKIKVQVHHCRICNAAFLDSGRSVQCMMNHQKPTNYKCGDCQLFFIGSKHLLDHEKLCHS